MNRPLFPLLHLLVVVVVDDDLDLVAGRLSVIL